MERAGPAAAGARRGHRSRQSTCSTAKRCSSSSVLGPLLRALPGLKVVLEHITTREAAQFVRSDRRQRRRDHHRAPPAAQPQRPVPGRHPPAPLLPAGAQARGAPRGAGRGRDLGQSEVLPRHRQRAARARHQGSCLRLRRRATPRTPRTRALRGGVRGGGRARQAGRLRQPLRAAVLRPAGATPAASLCSAASGRCPRRCPSAPGSWCRCAPARRFPGRSPSPPDLRSAAAVAGAAGAGALAGGAQCAGGIAGAAHRERHPGALRPALGRRSRTTRSTCSRSGEVHTRPENHHDLFNALCWLAFPRTKARINALHAAEIPREGGRRGRLRDLLTIFDEGGALVACADARLNSLIREFRWRELLLGAARPGALGDALRGAGPRGARAGAGAAARHHLQGPLHRPRARCGRRRRRNGSGDCPPVPPRACSRRCPSSAIPAGCQRASRARSTTTSAGSGRCNAETPLPGRRMRPGRWPGSRCGDTEESPGSTERDAG